MPKGNTRYRILASDGESPGIKKSNLVASMPLSPEQLNSLLDYLDANLKSRDHTTKLTDIFLHVEEFIKDVFLLGLPITAVTAIARYSKSSRLSQLIQL